MAKGVVMLLVLLTVLSAVSEAQQQHRPGHRTLSHGHRRSAEPAAPTHLHFYFHDTVSGSSPSAVRVVGPADPSSRTFFGMVNVMDDPLTEVPEPDSAVVGRAQGLYMGEDQAELGFLQTMNLVLTSGPYNSSMLENWRHPDPYLGIGPHRACPEDLMVTRWSCRAKAPHFVADDGDARRRRSLPEDVVVVLLFVSGFPVKTLVHGGLGSCVASRRFPS
ncbi:dirigent protein 21-like [Triticum dicoccoides]|uniref:dirigent protein 21-like n=1 Tax=Triticum dicoccoides TaxID=85692 RepID=UPI001891CF3F|nr:dirigent protein 21-like [Triticum dicoccoides]